MAAPEREICSTSELLDIFHNEDLTWDWFHMVFFKGEVFVCKKCRRRMTIQMNDKNYRYWNCSHCKIKKSVLDGTVFSKSKIGLGKTLRTLLLQWVGISINNTAELIGINRNTVAFWASVLRVVCMKIWNSKQIHIGGKGKIVEIDEAVWRRRKCRRGRRKEQIWLFGGVERLDGGGAGPRFVIIVPNRTKETLLPIILEYIKPETIIMSDEWKAYEC
ncbi:uncharacterized protein MONOS_9251 [Monocercomonoides exilis]|uniref:uncharacterized protein n=1 Tax=Monocercomonoides exilis TaxID=2049356 RepID=UPI0035593B78|nr:hypothetical protein MONOS_9251 [Monocercomonoides exilis]|eukprot:MONOS_9251.1-p1 / transcript=MONOS_9251.1 / gene=MONOS_9251 / organism=Monocercomonoides_exilis_PA203 / gene_product=unspecified product / transcript_product=unspecified product / location=Mono_scaffold00374:54027-54680(+) / protein_length=217 / sequence_SO=supercontig / SO=protein_coding / is_pseudo=false